MPTIPKAFFTMSGCLLFWIIANTFFQMNVFFSEFESRVEWGRGAVCMFLDHRILNRSKMTYVLNKRLRDMLRFIFQLIKER